MTTTSGTPGTSRTPNDPRPFSMHARTPEDLIAMAPAMLGFWPAESVVMFTFGTSRPFHARLPLLARADQTPARCRDAAKQMVDPAHRFGTEQVVLVYFSADPAAVAGFDPTLRRLFQEAGIDVMLVIYADGTHWRDVDDPGAEPVAYDIGSHPFVLEAIVSGRLKHDSRESLADSFAADPAEVARTAAVLIEGRFAGPPPTTARGLREEGEWVAARVARAVAIDATLVADELARLVWGMQALPVRDAAWAQIDRDNAADHVRFWGDVVRRTPDHLVAAPAALLSWSAWQAGDGATAWIGVDRCNEACPEYGLAGYMVEILERAVPPEAWRGPFDWSEGLP